MNSLADLRSNSAAFSCLIASGAAAMKAATAQSKLVTHPGYERSSLIDAGPVPTNFSGLQNMRRPEMGIIAGATGGVTPLAEAQMRSLIDAGGVASQTFQFVDVRCCAAPINSGNAQLTASARFKTVAGAIAADRPTATSHLPRGELQFTPRAVTPDCTKELDTNNPARDGCPGPGW